MKDIGGRLAQDWLTVRHYPVRRHLKLATIFTIMRARNSSLHNPSHLALLFRRERGRIVPEIDAVDVAVVEPQSGMVWVIHTLARARVQGKAARDDRALRSAQRIQYW